MLNMLQTTRKIPNLGRLGDVPDYGNEPDTTGQYPGTPPFVPPSAPSFDWANWAAGVINKTAIPILNAQFGGPQPGQYFSTNAKTGQAIAYSLPQGSNSSVMSSFSTGTFGSSNLMPLLLIGGGALVLMALFNRGK